MAIELYGLNVLAIVISAIVAFFSGMIWFSKPLFGEVWMRLSGITKESVNKQKSQGMAGTLVTAFITQIVTSAVLAWFIIATGMQSALGGLGIGALIWLGFLGTTQLGSVLWHQKPLVYYALESGHVLFALLVTGVILGAWA